MTIQALGTQPSLFTHTEENNAPQTSTSSYVAWENKLSAPASTPANSNVRPANKLTESANQKDIFTQTETRINLNAPITKLFTPKIPLSGGLATFIKGTTSIQNTISKP